MVIKTKENWEYGDFQTPKELAERAVLKIQQLNYQPNAIIEPTCGKGSFLIAASNIFPNVQQLVGVDISGDYIQEISNQISGLAIKDKIHLIQGDFFFIDWSCVLDSLPEPILIVGNPPWVTSSELGIIQSGNLPEKSNFQKRSGYDAITGKSNFDISEWMLLKHLDWLTYRRGMIAMLCKTSVARKALLHAWTHNLLISDARMYLINAPKYFEASVDACFLIVNMLGKNNSTDCCIYKSLEDKEPFKTIGYHDGKILADVDLFKKWRHLEGTDKYYRWRSGIKHDCSKIIELERRGHSQYSNGNHESVVLEENFIYPLLKSSDISNGKTRYGHKYMLVTQKYIGEDTSLIENIAPKTWHYLKKHERLLSKRASSVYIKHPKFSIFGVGDYSFSLWKVAISGFYKQLSFKVVRPYEGKSVVFDDTVYFIPCLSESEANFIASLLNSKQSQEFYSSMIFWDNKRPITIEVLKRLNLHKLSIELNSEKDYLQFSKQLT